MSGITLSNVYGTLTEGFEKISPKGGIYYAADIVIQLAPFSTDARIAKLAANLVIYQSVVDLTAVLSVPEKLVKGEWRVLDRHKEIDYLGTATAVSGIFLDIVISVDALQNLAFIDISLISATAGALFGPFVSGTLTLFYTLDAFDALATIHNPVRAFEAKDFWLWGETREERIREIRREKALELAGCVTKVAQQALIFAAVTQPELILAFGLISSGTVVVRYFVESDSGRALFKESNE